MYLYIAAKKYGRMININISKNERDRDKNLGEEEQNYIFMTKGIIHNFQKLCIKCGCVKEDLVYMYLCNDGSCQVYRV